VRSGNNLVYTATITLADALCAKPIKFKSLDGRLINVSMGQIITPKSIKIVKGEGMPIFDE